LRSARGWFIASRSRDIYRFAAFAACATRRLTVIEEIP
jgi:hypothetical protein